MCLSAYTLPRETAVERPSRSQPPGNCVCTPLCRAAAALGPRVPCSSLPAAQSLQSSSSERRQTGRSEVLLFGFWFGAQGSAVSVRGGGWRVPQQRERLARCWWAGGCVSAGVSGSNGSTGEAQSCPAALCVRLRRLNTGGGVEDLGNSITS